MTNRKPEPFWQSCVAGIMMVIFLGTIVYGLLFIQAARGVL